MRRGPRTILLTALIAVLAAMIGWPVRSLAWQSKQGELLASVEPPYLGLLHWRMVGPSRGGRVVAVAGDPVHKLVFYFGATGGGIWKTEDGGISWRNVSDGFVNTGSVGAVAVAPSNTERRLRRHGRGVRARRRVLWRRRLQIHRRRQDMDARRSRGDHAASRECACLPPNPDLVYVAALGDPWGPSAERGVFRSKDGGAPGRKFSTAASSQARPT